VKRKIERNEMKSKRNEKRRNGRERKRLIG
jgi:hypothetical protein